MKRKFFNTKENMKLKKKIYLFITTVFFLFTGTFTLQSQDFFAKVDDKVPKYIEKPDNSSRNAGGIFRDDNDDWGNDGQNQPSDPSGKDEIDPIGEGIVVLSLLAGAYSLIKRRNSRKKIINPASYSNC